VSSVSPRLDKREVSPSLVSLSFRRLIYSLDRPFLLRSLLSELHSGSEISHSPTLTLGDVCKKDVSSYVGEKERKVLLTRPSLASFYPVSVRDIPDHADARVPADLFSTFAWLICVYCVRMRRARLNGYATRLLKLEFMSETCGTIEKKPRVSLADASGARHQHGYMHPPFPAKEIYFDHEIVIRQ